VAAGTVASSQSGQTSSSGVPKRRQGGSPASPAQPYQAQARWLVPGTSTLSQTPDVPAPQHSTAKPGQTSSTGVPIARQAG
jgi:uncharacterized Zn-binding protein involved in type VI secretion